MVLYQQISAVKNTLIFNRTFIITTTQHFHQDT